ncbi:HAD-IIB family hydrolase [Variovorax sp. YR752]|uniref:HAD-IIB family hydrolase n=1 Tax=Variovorax sp. YR752 TaxID=1884383 RepID=UPI0031380BBD
MPDRALPLADCPDRLLAPIHGVLTDIDDTLTHEGAIEPEALEALARLRAAGVPVIAITGRPMGWSEAFARPPPQGWPIDAIVAENGAVALFAQGGVLHTEYAQDAAVRTHNARRLAEVAQRVLREVPGATLARDSAGRVTDIAIDHSEFTQLPPQHVDAVVAIMRTEGMNATVSSIHVNGWFGEHDKRSGARWIVQRLLGRDVEAECDRWAYVGDSTNDQLMFEHYPFSVGVANLMRFAEQLQVWPAWLTRAERGRGFAEFAGRLLKARAR